MEGSGWYNDESDPALARWHDGVAWTDHVLEKADWEAIGVEPPPPEDVHDTCYVAGRIDRRRAVVAAAVAVAVLAVGGVALARDGSDPRSERPPTDGQSEPSERLGDATGAGVDVPVLDAEIVGSDPGDDPAAVGGSTAGGDTSRSRTTPSTTSGGVRRTEAATNTHTNPGPITSSGDKTSGDKTSVGHTNDTTISNRYEPPPSTTTTTTVADSTTTTTTVDSTTTTVDSTTTP